MQRKILKKNLNSNIHLSEGNIKSKSTDKIMFLTWSLPCKIACPYSTEMCRKRCFAQKNQYFKNVLASRMRNLEETKKDTFVQDMIEHFEYQLQRKKAKDKNIFVRIHTAGDFYSLDYFEKWVKITNHFKNNDKILFQAYTKSMPIIIKWLEKELSKSKCSTLSRVLIQNINIHFVWSVWDDTPKAYTDRAKELELQTFTALPKNKIDSAVKNGSFLCNGDCGICRECYTGKSKSIVIAYH